MEQHQLNNLKIQVTVVLIGIMSSIGSSVSNVLMNRLLHLGPSTNNIIHTLHLNVRQVAQGVVKQERWFHTKGNSKWRLGGGSMNSTIKYKLTLR